MTWARSAEHCAAKSVERIGARPNRSMGGKRMNLLLLPPAPGPDLQVPVLHRPVLPREGGLGQAVGLAEVAAVFQQAAFLAAVEADRDLGDGGVGDREEAGSEAGQFGALDRDRVDEADL